MKNNRDEIKQFKRFKLNQQYSLIDYLGIMRIFISNQKVEITLRGFAIRQQKQEILIKQKLLQFLINISIQYFY
ncbi:hypothetical protein pb186bvf_020534 [Paramecium bursaria]